MTNHYGQVEVYERIRDNFVAIQELRAATGAAPLSYIPELIELLDTAIALSRGGREEEADKILTRLQSRIKNYSH